jgi:hypothetical protein
VAPAPGGALSQRRFHSSRCSLKQGGTLVPPFFGRKARLKLRCHTREEESAQRIEGARPSIAVA